MTKISFPWMWVIPTLVLSLAGCTSLEKGVLHSVDDMLSKDGSGTVFTGEDDPQLVADSLPFAIKMYESLWASDPSHPGMARTLGMMYTVYAHAFVAGPADYLGDDKYAEKQAAKVRALKFYLRGRNYELKALDLLYPGFSAVWASGDLAGIGPFLDKFKKEDVGCLYWLMAGQMSALSLSPMDLDLSHPIPLALKVLDRAYALDPDYQKSALDELMVSVYASLPGSMGGDPDLAVRHFDLAEKKSGNKSTGAFMAYAGSIDLPKQDKAHFIDLLNKTLAVDPSANPGTTLSTILDQEKARWYLGHLDELFVE